MVRYRVNYAVVMIIGMLLFSGTIGCAQQTKPAVKPAEVINVQAVTCNQFVVNHNVVYSLTVKADEGQADFSS